MTTERSHRTSPVSVLFVCTGNICRSPTAEAVFRTLVEREGFKNRIHIDSAGIHDYHVGDAPDPRSQAAALRRGYDLSEGRARRVSNVDCNHDYLLVMDSENERALRSRCPDAEVRHFLSFAPHLGVTEVPDPYYGDDAGFERVLELCEAAAAGLLEDIRRRHLSA